MEGTRKIILVDGVCNLCNGFVNFVFALDANKEFMFAAQQSRAGQEIIKRYGLRTDLKTIYYVEEETRSTWQQSSAVLRVMSYLPAPYSALYWFMAVPWFVRDPVYKIIATNRYRLFGKHDGDVCYRRPGVQKRFLPDGLELMPMHEYLKEV